MITVNFNGTDFLCEKAIKGKDYVHLLDENNVIFAAFEGVSDFSCFTISGGDWTIPESEDDCFVAVVKADGTIGKGGHKCKDINPNLAGDENGNITMDGLNTTEGLFSTTLGTGNQNQGNKCLASGTNNKILAVDTVDPENQKKDENGNPVPPNSCVVLGQTNEVSGYVMAAFVYGDNNKVRSGSHYSFIGGDSNEVTGTRTYCFGARNKNSGQNSMVGGDSNENNSVRCLVLGINNKSNPNNDGAAKGQNGIVAGENNINEGRSNLVVGKDCVSRCDAKALYGNSMIGVGLYQKDNTNGELIIGKYNKQVAKRLFSIGNGTSVKKSTYTSATEIIGLYYADENKVPVEITSKNAETVFKDTKITTLYQRQNAFEVTTDGRAKVQSAPTEPDDVVRNQELNAAVTKITDGSTVAAKATNADYATSAGSATKVNNLEIKKDSNGVLKIGDIIIPQKKLLWSGNVAPENWAEATTICSNLTYGKYIEIQLSTGATVRCKNVAHLPVNVYTGTASEIQGVMWYYFNNAGTNLTVTPRKQGTYIGSTFTAKVIAIYEVIE